MILLRLLAVLAFARVATSCSCSKPKAGLPEDEPTVATAVVEPKGRARQIFSTRCASCHGLDGKGQGPAARMLAPKPRDYSGAEWQASTTDDQIRRIIVKGGPALGKSPAMPESPDLADEPEVVNELVAILRAFGAGAAPAK